MNHSESLISPATPVPDAPRWRDVLRDGSCVAIRPITQFDVDKEREFISTLSPQSRRFRFLGQIGEPSEQLLKQLTTVDYRQDAAFAAIAMDDPDDRFIGVARFSVTPDRLRCECAVAVLDDWQHRGLGVILMTHLIEVARDRGIETMYSLDAAENAAMTELARFLGFTSRIDHDDPTLLVHSLRLSAGIS